MSVLFGEVIEPSTRALIDEDLEEYPDYVRISAEWEGNSTVPKAINSLIFLESKLVKDLVRNCVLIQEPVCKLTNGGIEIFLLADDNYLILYIEEKELNPGQIVEALENWICGAKTIYTLTSDSIHNYQNQYYAERPVSLVRILTNSENTLGYKLLEQPNLVTGLGANILSYCIHLSFKKCTLLIVYVDKSLLDSYLSSAIVDIFKKLNLPWNCSNIKISSSSSNLYM